MEHKEMISVRGLTKSYGKTIALNDVSFSLYEGDLFGFIGPNGAGKTTCLRIMATVLKPDSGEVRLGGFSLSHQLDKIRGIIGFMPDFLGVYDDLLVRDYLEFFSRAYHLESHLRSYAIKEAATITGIEPLLERPVESLSRGMKQRLGLAKTLLHNPRILLLDEPASGLDPLARVELREIIKSLQKSGKTIMISSHILSDLADVCNKVGIIEQGKLVLCEDMETLLGMVSRGKNVRIKTLSESENARIFLEEHRKVSDLLWDGESLTFSFDGSDADLHQLLRELVEKEIPLIYFGEFSNTLESVYLKIIEESGMALRHHISEEVMHA
jgi:ABC-2 type transport system ATP-binding protein